MASQPSDAERSALVGEVCQVTGTDPSTAMADLQQNGWDAGLAVTSFFDEGDAGEDSEEDEAPPPASFPASSRAPNLAASASSPSAKQNASTNRGQNSKLRTLKDLQSGPAHNDDDSDKEQEYFAGGDKSALAVQDPNSGGNRPQDQIRRLIENARRGGQPPPEEQPSRSNFSGQGQTLGGDDVESRVIPDPNAAMPVHLPQVTRTLHLWADGFSIDDGQLYVYDDPRNAQILDMINSGSAPLEVMNVQSGQSVDVKLDSRRDEKYVQPKTKFVPFSSGGQRLGSPTPSASSSSVAQTPAPAIRPAATTSSASAAPRVNVDTSQPTITLQIRLADGTRLSSQFNTTHTVGDVYDFVDRASATGGRPYVMATTFPTKDLTDRSQGLGDIAEFKRGGSVVQKWT